MPAPLILLVDNDEDLRLILCRFFEDAGYAVREAANGQEAYSLLEATQVDLVLSDLNMPVMDGRALLTAIRAHPRLNGLPFILASSDADEATAAGTDSFITKKLSRNS